MAGSGSAVSTTAQMVANVKGVSVDNQTPGKAIVTEVIVRPDADVKDQPTEEARQLVYETARDRQFNNKPARPKRKYRVQAEIGGDKIDATIEATDENEAWALVCDQRHEWPSPKRANRVVTLVS